MQSKIDPHRVVFKWIPYDQFNDIKELGKDEFTTVYSAIWKDGPLQYDYKEYVYSRNKNIKVNLKLYNSRNNINNVLNKVTYLFDNKYDEIIYGLSQYPHTKNYVIVFPDGYHCDKCGKEFEYKRYKWCKPCQINNLEKNFTNWSSGNENIDNLIQEMQSKISSYEDIVFEWIPYDQFCNIKEIGKGGFSKIYSATWINGRLMYDISRCEYIRCSITIALKCLNNSQNISNEFLNEVKAYSVELDIYNFRNKRLHTYGISQNPDTKEYIMVLKYAKGGDFNCWMKKNYKNLNWSNKLDVLSNIIIGLEEIHQNKMVHRDFHTGNILLNKSHLKDILLFNDIIKHFRYGIMWICQ
uniref:Protein kinase domain-containing protein n=1 Tax=Rhizophagus irregularis (strain DAOM 181602 / DAOM 197198 / MUCL 43194) TaxID=747089 RepID=U9TQ44_RHIID